MERADLRPAPDVRNCRERELRAEGATAATSGLHLRIAELEAGAFESFDVIDFGAIEIDHAGGIDEDFEVAEIIGFVEHAGLGFESHRVAETGTATADDGDAETSRLGFLHAEDFCDFANGIFGELNHNELLEKCAHGGRAG